MTDKSDALTSNPEVIWVVFSNATGHPYASPVKSPGAIAYRRADETFDEVRARLKEAGQLLIRAWNGPIPQSLRYDIGKFLDGADVSLSKQLETKGFRRRDPLPNDDLPEKASEHKPSEE